MENSASLYDFLKEAALIGAVITAAVSFWSAKHEATMNTITKQRLDFITSVRNKVGEFLTEYFKSPDENPSQDSLMLKKAEVDLWLNKTNIFHVYLSCALDACVTANENENEKKICVDNVVDSTQILLNFNWKIMEREAKLGWHRNTEKKMINEMLNELEKNLPLD